VAKRSANEVAYLVPQGQEEVIEEDGGGCNYIILMATARSQSEEQCKSMPTFLAVLGASKSKGRITPK